MATWTCPLEHAQNIKNNDESHDELSTLVNKISISPTCSPEEYLAGDDLPICDDASDDWDNQFIAELNQNQLDDSTREDDDESFDLQPPLLDLSYCMIFNRVIPARIHPFKTVEYNSVYSEI